MSGIDAGMFFAENETTPLQIASVSVFEVERLSTSSATVPNRSIASERRAGGTHHLRTPGDAPVSWTLLP